MSNKKTIIGSAAAIVASVALIGGGTFAAWSDFDVVDDQEVAAGTLVIDVVEPDALPWDDTDIAPGYRESIVYTLDMSESSIDGILRTAFYNEDGPNFSETEDGCLTSNTEQNADPDHELVDGESDCGEPNSGELADWSLLELAYAEPAPGVSCDDVEFEVAGSRAADFAGFLNGADLAFDDVTYGSLDWSGDVLPVLETEGKQPTLRSVVEAAESAEESTEAAGFFLPNRYEVAAGTTTVCVFVAFNMPLLSDDPNADISLAQNAAQGDTVSFGLKFQIEQDLES